MPDHPEARVVSPTLIEEQFVDVTVILQYPGLAETLPGTVEALEVVSFTLDPPNDQLSFAVNVVDLLEVTEYQPVALFAVQLVAVTVNLP